MRCKTHRDRTARRKCFLCKGAICPECQLKAHHHIFCSTGCSEKYWKQEEDKVRGKDLHAQLEDLDTGLNEDIREYGEAIVDAVNREFEQLVNDLDRALTSIATMVEGSASAASGELAQNVEDLKALLAQFERAQEERASLVADRDSGAKQLLMAIRDSQTDKHKEVVEKELPALVRQLERLYERQLDQQTDRIKQKIVGLDKHIAKVNKRLKENAGTAQGRDEKTRSTLQENEVAAKARSDETASHIEKAGEKAIKEIASVGESLDLLQKRLLEEEIPTVVTEIVRRILERGEEDQTALEAKTKEIISKLEASDESFRNLEAESKERDQEIATSLSHIDEEFQKHTQTLVDKEIPRMLQDLDQRQASHLDERVAEVQTVISQFQNEVAEGEKDAISERKKLEESAAAQRKNLEDIVRKTNESWEKELAALRSHFEQSLEEMKEKLLSTRKVTEATMQSFGELETQLVAQMDERLEYQLRKLFDDIATLTVAQRGNWRDVIDAAQAGAEKVSESVRKDIYRKLTAEVEALAKEQSRSIGLSISDVHRQLANKVNGPKRMPYVIAAAAMAFLFVGASVGMLWPDKETSKVDRLSTLESTLAQQDDRFAALIDEKLALLKVKEEPETLVRASREAIIRGNTKRKEIAFTFDGGSNSKATQEILDILKAHSIRSTMFLTGRFLKSNPGLVRRMVKDGHEVGNHLLEHWHLVDPKDRFTVFTRPAFHKQLREVEKKFSKITGKKLASYWRAPYGSLNKEVLRWAADIGYTHIGWTRSGRRSLDTLDWVADPNDRLYLSSDGVMDRILSFGRKDRHGLNGAVVLMHLGTERKRDFPHRKLPELFNQLAGQGYRFVTVSQLFRAEAASR